MPEEKKAAMSDNGSSTPAKGGMKGLIIGIVAVVVLAGVAFGLYQWSGGKSMTPEERTSAMAKKLSETESMSFSAKMDVELGKTSIEGAKTMLAPFGVEGEVSHVVLSGEGKSGMDAEDKPLSSVDLTLSGQNSSGEDQIALSMSIRMVQDLLYLQLHALPDEVKNAVTAQAGMDISFLEDQWIELNVKDLIEQLGLPEEELKAFENQQLTKEEKDKVTAAFVNHTFLKLEGEPTEEEVRDQKTLKYETKLDVAEMKAFLEEIKPIMVDKEIATEEEYTEMLSKFEENYNKMLEETNLEIHTWVGKKDNNLYKVEVMLSPVDQNDVEELVDITMTLEMWDHGKEVTVDKPEDAMTIQEVIGQLVVNAGGAQVEGAQEEKKEEKKQ